MLLDILRVAQNHMRKVDRDKSAPTMRPEVAKGPVRYEGILYFTRPLDSNRLNERPAESGHFSF